MLEDSKPNRQAHKTQELAYNKKNYEVNQAHTCNPSYMAG
jgi:hypothetical protein